VNHGICGLLWLHHFQGSCKYWDTHTHTHTHTYIHTYIHINIYIAVLCSFLWQNNISLYGCTKIFPWFFSWHSVDHFCLWKLWKCCDKHLYTSGFFLLTYVFVSLTYRPKRGLQGYTVSLCSTIWETARIPFKVAIPIYIPNSNVWGVYVSIFLLTLVIIRLPGLSHPHMCEVIFYCGFVFPWRFTMYNIFFMCLLTIYIYPLGKRLHRSFAYFD
jgi:hypothetical protein